MQRYDIGEWSFSPDDGELSRDGQRVRLEDRAARTLALLLRHRGELVSHQAIVEEVWQGRSLSPNTVAVVIRDLRQALGCDARAPRYIETVAKRGYRLIAAGRDTVARPSPARVLAMALAGLTAAAAVAVLTWGAMKPRSGPMVAVGPVENATGSPAYGPLSDALSELLVADLGQPPQIAFVRGPARPANDAIALNSRLIMWSGKPALVLSAERGPSHAVIWTGMAGGPEAVMPPAVATAVADFKQSLRRGQTSSAG